MLASASACEHAVVSVFALQSRGGFEDATLTLYVLEVFFAAGRRHVFPKTVMRSSRAISSESVTATISTMVSARRAS